MKTHRILFIITLTLVAVVAPCHLFGTATDKPKTPRMSYDFVQEAIKAGVKTASGKPLEPHQAYAFVFDAKAVETAPKNADASAQFTLKGKIIKNPEKLDKASIITQLYGANKKNGFRIKETADAFVNLKSGPANDCAVVCIDNSFFPTATKKKPELPAQTQKNGDIVSALGGTEYKLFEDPATAFYDGAMAIGSNKPELIFKSRCFVFYKKPKN